MGTGHGARADIYMILEFWSSGGRRRVVVDTRPPSTTITTTTRQSSKLKLNSESMTASALACFLTCLTLILMLMFKAIKCLSRGPGGGNSNNIACNQFYLSCPSPLLVPLVPSGRVSNAWDIYILSICVSIYVLCNCNVAKLATTGARGRVYVHVGCKAGMAAAVGWADVQLRDVTCDWLGWVLGMASTACLCVLR